MRGLSLVAASGGYPPVAVREPLIVAASLVTENGLQGAGFGIVSCWLSVCSSRTREYRLSSCGTWA